MVKIGDKIENARDGINGINIPVGATVRYHFGVDRGGADFKVVLRDGKKLLSLTKDPDCTQTSHGQRGVIEVLSLPE